MTTHYVRTHPQVNYTRTGALHPDVLHHHIGDVHRLGYVSGMVEDGFVNGQVARRVFESAPVYMDDVNVRYLQKVFKDCDDVTVKKLPACIQHCIRS